MSIQFWSTMQSGTGDLRCGFDKHSGEHAISLITPNAREIAEKSEEGVCLYTEGSHKGSLSGRVCQLRVADSDNTSERFLSCPSDWEMETPDVASTGCRSPLTMRQLAVSDIGLPPCFDWWINRRTSSLSLSLVINGYQEQVNLSANRYGDSLLSLTFCGKEPLQNTQISGPLASVRTLRLIGVEMVTADDLHRFPKLERLSVTQRTRRFIEARVDFGASQTSGGRNALTPWVHLQHLSIDHCFRVCLPESLMLFPHLRSLSLHGSNLGSPLHFPPEMPQLTHLDLLVLNPERIGQLPHSPNLRFLALKDLDIAFLRTVLGRSQSLRHLEGRINSVESFDISSLEPFMYVIEVLHIHDSPQLRNLTFPTCDSSLSLKKLTVSSNCQLTALDVSGCVNLAEFHFSYCEQLSEVVGLAGLVKLEKVDAYENPQLATLDVSGCVNLTEIDFSFCEQLSEVVGLAGLVKLEILFAYNNPQLATLDVTGCVGLTHLHYADCSPHLRIVDLETLPKTGS